MAKREPIQKPEPFKKQQRLFDTTPNQPTQKWNPHIDREGIDQKARSMIAQGRATYTKGYNSITCLLCNKTTDYHLSVNNNYCMNCNVLHDEDYAENQRSDDGVGES